MQASRAVRHLPCQWGVPHLSNPYYRIPSDIPVVANEQTVYFQLQEYALWEVMYHRNDRDPGERVGLWLLEIDRRNNYLLPSMLMEKSTISSYIYSFGFSEPIGFVRALLSWYRPYSFQRDITAVVKMRLQIASVLCSVFPRKRSESPIRAFRCSWAGAGVRFRFMWFDEVLHSSSMAPKGCQDCLVSSRVSKKHFRQGLLFSSVDHRLALFARMWNILHSCTLRRERKMSTSTCKYCNGCCLGATVEYVF